MSNMLERLIEEVKDPACWKGWQKQSKWNITFCPHYLRAFGLERINDTLDAYLGGNTSVVLNLSCAVLQRRDDWLITLP